MKKTFSVIIALFLILGFRLASYSSDDPKEPMLFPTPTEAPAFGDKVFIEVTSSPTSAGDLMVGERATEKVVPSPTPVEEKIFREVTPSPTPVGDPVVGEKLFVSACRICHRKNMIHNEFIAGSTDQALVEFIKTGGVPGQPFVMLPKGGKPSLTDQNLYDIVAYLRTLQK